MLSAPFQCHDCWFFNITRRRPKADNHTDRVLLSLIRRVNLDILWSRESSTVVNTYNSVYTSAKIAVSLGMPLQNIEQGPWPVGDHCGFAIAVTMLRKSLDPGRNDALYQQFDSIRKLRSAWRNTYLNSVLGSNVTQVFMGEKGRTYRLTADPTYSQSFTKFIHGCEKRMGRRVKQDQAVSIAILKELLKNFRSELQEKKVTRERKRDIIMSANSLVVGYCGALRGGEILLAEATSICEAIESGRIHEHPHVLLCLMGRFKSETGERNVILPLASVTASGIEVRWWMEALVKILEVERRSEGSPGPAFCDRSGFVLGSNFLNEKFHEALERVQTLRPDLIPSNVKVREIYNMYRSLRRGAVLRANELEYDQSVIDMNNRWRQMQSARGKAKLPMGQLYLDILLSLISHIRFSKSL